MLTDSGRMAAVLGLASVILGLLAASGECAPYRFLRQEREASPMRELSESDWKAIVEAHESARYALAKTQSGLEAHNRGQGWRSTFDGQGFTIQPADESWSWGLQLDAYGFPGHEVSAQGSSRVHTENNRLAYEWGSTIEEWFINDRRGLEHGFTIRERPEGGVGPLSIHLRIRGTLSARDGDHGDAITFRAAAREAALTYAGLVVQDAAKRVLPARMRIGDQRLSIVIDDREALYPLVVDPVAQQAYIKASNTGPEDRFGCSVAVSGDTAIVGAFLEDSNATGVNGNGNNDLAANAGAAYVFVRNGTAWTQQAYLKASNTAANDQFGFSVAISGDIAVVGANLEDSASTGVNGVQSDNSVTSSGAAYVFVRSGTTWTQQAYLKASNTGANDFFGASVAVSGEVIAVGAHLEDSAATGIDGDGTNNAATDSGAVYAFERQGSTWVPMGYIKASNTGASDQFGSSVALSMGTLVVGASNEDSNALGVNGNQLNDGAGNAGAAYVFVRSGATWIQQAYLKASNTGLFDEFGHDVAISGDTILVGARQEDSGATGVNGDQASNSVGDSGAAYVFVRNGGTWQQQAYLKASNTGVNDQFGFSVSISGNSAVVGAVAEDSNATGINGDGINNASIGAGSAYVFVRSGTVWSQSAYLKASNTGGNDQFGHSVAISGDIVFVSALGEASSATGINGNQLNNSIPNAGAAYVFDLDLHSGAAQYGSGTPGCAGPHALSETHVPMIGSPNFQLRCSAAPPTSLGLGLVSDAMSFAGVDSFGIGALLHVDLLASTEIITVDFVSDILGTGTGATPIPNDPLLIGKTYHCAVIWVWSSCSLPPFGISSSNGLTLTIQVP